MLRALVIALALMLGFSAQAGVTIDPVGKLMLEASGKFVAGDYAAAEALYTQALSLNSSHPDAYLQRGLVRRELGNDTGARADAQAAFPLIEAMAKGASQAQTHVRRSQAYRLLGRFDEAEAELRQAMRLTGSREWETDLKAIALERRMAGRK